MAADAIARHGNGADGAFEHATGDTQKIADINQLRIFKHGFAAQCAGGVIQGWLELRLRLPDVQKLLAARLQACPDSVFFRMVCFHIRKKRAQTAEDRARRIAVLFHDK